MKRSILFTLLFSMAIYGCETQSYNSTGVNIMLTDAPADYKEVWIDIQSVEIHSSSDSSEGQWITLVNFHSGLYNLLDYSNGNDTLLGSANISAGKISQIRLVLGDQNSVVTEEGTYPLKVPSGSSSGLKINLHETLQEGIMTNIWIDFNASKSILKKGNASYSLKPVIRAYTENISGAIKGIVDPKESLPTVFAIINTDTLTTKANTDGYFFFGGVPAGTYSVKFEPVDPYLDSTVVGVQVVNGEFTDMCTVQIQKEQ